MKKLGLDAYILDAKRTPIGRSHAEKGMFRGVRADELFAGLLEGMLPEPEKRELIDDVIVGCVGQHLEQGKNIARLALLLARYPEKTAGVTVNRLCGSSLQAFIFASQTLATKHGDCVLAGGVEHMHHVPMQAALDYNQELLERYPFPFTQMGLTAEKLAMLYRITRKQQDEWSLLSHQRAVRAEREGFFKNEIMSIEKKGECWAKDQLPRSETSLEALSALKPVFLDNGMVTAGNSSPIADGASLCLVASAEGARRMNIRPQAQLIAAVVLGLDPLNMGLGPVPAIRTLLTKCGLTLEDIGRFEINEAFAAQFLACQRELDIPEDKVNVNGGAIALGHPLGCTGTRLIATLLNELRRSRLEFGIAALCVGHGQGMAVLIRQVEGVAG